MGRKDKTQKQLVGCKDVCAELLNVLIYEGREVVMEDDLLPAPTESIYSQMNGAQELQQFMDYSMYEMQNGEVCARYNFENQSSVDGRLVLRSAGYDGMAYRKQYTDYKKHTGKSKVRQGIYPVISLVLNWSQKPWKAARSIRELLDYPVAREAEPYIDRNEIHVFDMQFLDEAVRKKFHGDMRVILDYLADPESLRKSTQLLRNPEEVLRMLAALSGDNGYLKYMTINKGKRGKTCMCEVLNGAIREGLERGRREGHREGRKEERKEGLKVLICACKELSHTYPETVEQLKKRYALSDEEVEKNMKLYW